MIFGINIRTETCRKQISPKYLLDKQNTSQSGRNNSTTFVTETKCVYKLKFLGRQCKFNCKTVGYLYISVCFDTNFRCFVYDLNWRKAYKMVSDITQFFLF